MPSARAVLTVLTLAPSLLLCRTRPLQAQQPAAADTATSTQDVVEEGRKIFHGPGQCFSCHGGRLQGGPIAPPLTGPKWKHIDGSFEAILHTVRGGYPGSAMVAHPGGIDDNQTLQVANYVYAVSQHLTKP